MSIRISRRHGLAAAISALAFAHRAHAADGPIHFATDLSAEEQTTLTLSGAAGMADFVLERETLKFSWKVTFAGLTSAIIGANVHAPQMPGANAGVQFALGDKPYKSPLAGFVILTEGQLEYLLAGRMYVNITTTKYPAGEIRGQIRRLRAPRS